MRGRRVARASDAPSRARRFAAREAMISAPLTALMPALGDGHTHEAQATRGAQVTNFERARSRILEG